MRHNFVLWLKLANIFFGKGFDLAVKILSLNILEIPSKLTVLRVNSYKNQGCLLYLAGLLRGIVKQSSTRALKILYKLIN